MGSAQSYLSPEAAVTVLVVAGAVGLGYTQVAHPPTTNTSTANVSAVTAGEGTAKKGKKKKQAKVIGDISETGSASKAQLPQPRVVAFPEIIPGQFDSTPAVAAAPLDLSAPEAATASSKSKKSKKKKGKSSAIADTTTAQAAASSSLDYLSESSVKAAKPKNAKRPSSNQQTQSQQATQATPPAPASSQLTRPLQLSTASLDTDSSWTRVGSRRRGGAASANDAQPQSAGEPTTSDAGATTPHTGTSSPVAERATTTEDESESFLLQQAAAFASRDSGNNRKTLAEKLLPKPRKTGVDDMLETPDYPTVARVMRVQPLPNEKPASGFSWGDYEDVRVTTDGGENDADGEDDGWGVVTSKRSKRTPSSTGAASSQSHSLKAPETLTKRQRQNAQKREGSKAAKAEGEAERLEILAKHKRELERSRMAEQFSGKAGGGGKTPSGGMKASVDEKGKLVWE